MPMIARRTLHVPIRKPEIEPELEAHLKRNGYRALRVLPDGRIIGLCDLAYTIGLFVDLNRTGYSHRYCYEKTGSPEYACAVWDGKGHPPGPWIKRKGLYPELLGPGATEE